MSVTSGPAAGLLRKATVGYQNYVVGETANLLAATGEFVTALRADSLDRAKQLFGPTRIHYEAIEPVAESFGNLDPEIDARINDVANPSQWTGFHRIEQILWVQNTTAGTGVYATKLLADVTTLYHRVQTLTTTHGPELRRPAHQIRRRLARRSSRPPTDGLARTPRHRAGADDPPARARRPLSDFAGPSAGHTRLPGPPSRAPQPTAPTTSPSDDQMRRFVLRGGALSSPAGYECDHRPHQALGRAAGIDGRARPG